MEPEKTLAQPLEAREASRKESEAGGPPELPGYQLREKLGAGSFGEVWSAVQIRTGQEVAVKLLHAEDELLREIERLRRVAENPGVVSLLDADLNHRPAFYVMPWLRRGSLAGLTERPSVTQVVDWFKEMAGALQFMHGKGLLHCDLKPSNIMLDEAGHVRLVDFGQARSPHEAPALGTLGFMPPEQCMPGEAPSVAWDIYALGATVYFLLTANFPRITELDRTRLASSGQRLINYRAVLEGHPLLPIRSLNPEVDPDLACIVESCLHLEADRRPASAAQILEDLGHRERHEPLLCQRPWSRAYLMRRTLRKSEHRLALLFVATVLFLLGIHLFNTVEKTYVVQRLRARWALVHGVQLAEQGRKAEARLLWLDALRRLDTYPRFAEDSRLREDLAAAVHLHPPATRAWKKLYPAGTFFLGGRLLTLGEYARADLLAPSLIGAVGPGGRLHLFDGEGQPLAGTPPTFPTGALAMSARGDELVVVEGSGQVSRWSLYGGQRLQVLGAVRPSILSASSVAGAAAVSNGEGVWAWDGRWRQWLDEPAFVALSPDGRQMAAGGRSVWIGERELPLPSPAAGAPVWSPDSRWLAIPLAQECVLVEVASGETRTLSSPAAHLAFGERHLASATRDGELTFWEMPEGRLADRSAIFADVTWMGFDTDGVLVVVTNDDRMYGILPPGDLPVITRDHPGPPVALACTPGKGAVTAGEDRAVWSWHPGRSAVQVGTAEREVEGLQAAGHHAFAGGTVFDMRREKPLVEVPAARAWLHPDGALLAFSPASLMELPSGKVDRLAEDEELLAWHPAGRLLARAGPAEVGVWDLDRRDWRFRVREEQVEQLFFSSDGRWLCVVSDQVRLFDPESGVAGPSFYDTPADVAVGTEKVWAAGRDGWLRCWSMKDGAAMRVPESGAVRRLELSPGQRWLAAANSTGWRLYDAESATPVSGWLPLRGDLADLAFSLDGSELVTISSEGEEGFLQRWPIPEASAARPSLAEAEEQLNLQLDRTHLRFRPKN